jgi:hypothetical protein
MFASRYFADRYFAPRYFAKVGEEAAEPEPTEVNNSTRNWLSVGPHLALIVGVGLALGPLGACHGPGATLEAKDPPADTLDRCRPPACYPDPRPPAPPQGVSL